jgi:WD40 repeat protein
MASNDGKTTMIHWQNTKELLNFDFNSKFNEHLHSQFYFMDKFILQPEENKIVLYSYARRENGFIKLQAGSYTLNCQSITALAAANQFYSSIRHLLMLILKDEDNLHDMNIVAYVDQIICGLSNKIIQVFDTNAEQVSLTINQGHGKAVSCIRLNEAPKGQSPTDLCDIFMTSSVSNIDPIKLWDLRSARCILRISDTNPSYIVPSTRPSLSPCGRYIASGFEDNSVILL